MFQQMQTSFRRSIACAAVIAVSLGGFGGCSGSDRVDSSDVVPDSSGPSEDTGGHDTAETGPDLRTADCPNGPTARLSAAGPRESITGVHEGTIQVSPLSEVALDASPSSSAEGDLPFRFLWRIVDQPKNTLATFSSDYQLDDEHEEEVVRFVAGTKERKPELVVGLAGSYKVELRVWSESSNLPCDIAELTIDVRPTSEFYVDFRYPFQNVDSEGRQARYRQYPPTLFFQFKRGTAAAYDDPDDVIPAYWGHSPDTQNWGTSKGTSDDPRLGEVLDAAGTNRFVALDGVESTPTYVGAFRVYGDPADIPLDTQTRIYIDGELRKTIDYGLGRGQDDLFMELFRFEKNDDGYEIRETLTDLGAYPSPNP